MRAVPVFALVASVVSAALGVHTVRADPGPDLGAAAAALAPFALAPTEASVAAERALTRLADAPVTITRDARGLAHLVGTTAGHPLPLPAALATAAVPASPETMARAQLARVGALFGLVDPATELRLTPAPAGAGGEAPGEDRIVRFQQLRAGVPVLGGELAVVLDPVGALRSVTGETLPSPAGAPTEPATTVDAATARTAALALVARAHPGSDPAALRADAPTRWYLDPALIGIPVAQHMIGGPVWRTEVSDRSAIRELVLVDARTGAIPLHLNLIASLNRVVCDRANKATADGDCKPTYARTEGGAPKTGGGAGEVNAAYDNTARTSAFYSKYVGVDLTKLLGVNTGDGTRLRSTVRYCAEDNPCATTQGLAFDNAFWNGRGMYYGTGWPNADDVVGHELTHGVTERTSHLLYLYQSGAINESMSDIFGELTDLTDNADGAGLQVPWTIGEDAPLDYFPLRNMADPRLTFQPDRMTSDFYDKDVFFTDNGGVHANNGVANKAASLIATGTGSDLGGVFNGVRTAGIGIAKTARLFYRAQQMLTSGADYADLGGVLNQGCADLVGKYGFTSASCAAVKGVVTATEMAKQPTGIAAAPEARFCPTATSKATIFSDNFEKFSTKRWSLGAQWREIEDYARSGTGSIYGVEPDRSASSAATLRTPLSIPRGVRTYLRFAHQYRLDAGVGSVGPYYDGARVEYRVGSGSWTSASKLPAEGLLPNKKVDPDPGAAYTAFGGDSRGYASTRLDVSSLAGKTVQFRWRVFGDKQTAVDGWTIDDVAVFACGTTTPSEARSVKVSGTGSTRTLSWSPPVFTPKGFTGYKLVRKGGGAAKQVKKVGTSKRSVKFTGLKKGKKYTFQVIPQSKAGAGPTAAKKTKNK